jgi:hypothetical protein
MPFDVMVGGQKVTVIRPYGTIPGSRMEVSVDNKKSDNGRTASSQTLERSNNAANQGHWQLFSIVTLWLGFEAAAFVLLILCLSHNPFATLQISSSCRLLNPKTGSVLREGYFNLWQGFGDTPECSTKSGHFW